MARKKRVLIVDDSALFRTMIRDILNSDYSLDVVGEAADPYEARDKIKALAPDVITLDVEMPKMDGITFLKNLMRLHPMPVVMVSSLTAKGASITLQALELGAVDFVTKPSAQTESVLTAFGRDVVFKVKTAAEVNVQKFDVKRNVVSVEPRTSPKVTSTSPYPKDSLVVVGASTGGVDAIKTLLLTLPTECSPVVITQHIPPLFSAHFASRMNEVTPFTVYEATHGQILEKGCAYIAPGDYHLRIVKTATGLQCRCAQDDQVNGHRPSVDILFDSILALQRPKNTVGVILTGMGNDGAAAMKRLYEQGVVTIAQDEDSSVVWGMPGSAVKLNAASRIISISKISDAISAILLNKLY